MIPWKQAFDRLQGSEEFQSYFSKGRSLQMADFRYIGYCQQFNNVTAGSVTGGATPSTPLTPGAQIGPALQLFPQGAIILGITAAGVQPQTTTSAFTYAPSASPGRRDLFALNFQYTGDEVITPGGPVLAEALLGSGEDTIFPGREIIVPPSQGILCAVQSYAVAPAMNVHIVYHSMVLRVAN